ncbi:Hypothetical predicted protein [Octopus vulgaris]|uniref:Uncharacterized protein n=1 Tax=Octopus vulgaris TaxID=6645 RepID=A0AA36F791_OCTVU|nr:Hypothetical predicted protein [Octopus vulgaris]
MSKFCSSGQHRKLPGGQAFSKNKMRNQRRLSKRTFLLHVFTEQTSLRSKVQDNSPPPTQHSWLNIADSKPGKLKTMTSEQHYYHAGLIFNIIVHFTSNMGLRCIGLLEDGPRQPTTVVIDDVLNLQD